LLLEPLELPIQEVVAVVDQDWALLMRAAQAAQALSS
jgi:hypothetical protein